VFNCLDRDRCNTKLLSTVRRMPPHVPHSYNNYRLPQRSKSQIRQSNQRGCLPETVGMELISTFLGNAVRIFCYDVMGSMHVMRIIRRLLDIGVVRAVGPLYRFLRGE